MNLRANLALCRTYVGDMEALGEKVILQGKGAFNASTDMGNVSHIVPSFHGGFAIPTEPDVAGHNPKFAAAAGTDEAHRRAMLSAKGMAMLAMRVLVDGEVAEAARRDFENKDSDG